MFNVVLYIVHFRQTVIKTRIFPRSWVFQQVCGYFQWVEFEPLALLRPEYFEASIPREIYHRLIARRGEGEDLVVTVHQPEKVTEVGLRGRCDHLTAGPIVSPHNLTLGSSLLPLHTLAAHHEDGSIVALLGDVDEVPGRDHPATAIAGHLVRYRAVFVDFPQDPGLGQSLVPLTDLVCVGDCLYQQLRRHPNTGLATYSFCTDKDIQQIYFYGKSSVQTNSSDFPQHRPSDKEILRTLVNWVTTDLQ